MIRANACSYCIACYHLIGLSTIIISAMIPWLLTTIEKNPSQFGAQAQFHLKLRDGDNIISFKIKSAVHSLSTTESPIHFITTTHNHQQSLVLLPSGKLIQLSKSPSMSMAIFNSNLSRGYQHHIISLASQHDKKMEVF